LRASADPPITVVYVHAYPGYAMNLYAGTGQRTSRQSHSASTRRLDRELAYGPDRNLPALLGWLRTVAQETTRGTRLASRPGIGVDQGSCAICLCGDFDDPPAMRFELRSDRGPISSISQGDGRQGQAGNVGGAGERYAVHAEAPEFPYAGPPWPLGALALTRQPRQTLDRVAVVPPSGPRRRRHRQRRTGLRPPPQIRPTRSAPSQQHQPGPARRVCRRAA
jgi:hypothetical protein